MLSSTGQLLAATARRCLRTAAEVGGVVLIIDAKNDRAARWYRLYGTVPLRNKPLALVMSLATFAAGLKAAGRSTRMLSWGNKRRNILGFSAI